MKKFLLTLMIAVGSLSFVVADAEAKRMGGGGSFGKQSNNVSRQSTPPSQQQAAPAQSAAPAAAGTAGAAGAAANAAKPSMMKGLLGGALLGLGLGALLSHFGIGGALASMIGTILMVALLAGAAFFIYRMVTRKNGAPVAKSAFQPAYAGSGNHGGPVTPEIGSRIEPQAPAALQSPAAFGSDRGADNGTWTIPADFDVPAFARNAKTYFIRLQAAWDAGNSNDIREFTTPEMFAELRMQLQERGASANHTDVVELDAQVLGVETVGNDYLVSVRFTGLIKEDEQAAAQPFTEVWNLTKPVSGNGGWLLAGVQQVQ